MLKHIASAAAAVALLTAAGTAAAAPTQTAPIFNVDPVDGNYYTATYANDSVTGTFSDTYTFTGLTDGVGVATISASWVAAATDPITFTSVTLNGINLDLTVTKNSHGKSTGVTGATPDNVSIPAGTPLTVVVTGKVNGTSSRAYNGTITFTPNPAPAPLAAGLPLLLAGGVLAMRKTRRTVAA
jgi:hypothetical protein